MRFIRRGGRKSKGFRSGPRAVRRTWRPLVERLEDRRLLALILFSESGPTPASLSGAIDTYKAALGGANNGTGGTFTTGFRQITWDDGTDDSVSDPNNLPADFFNTTSPRGAVFSGATFRLSAAVGNPTSTPVEFGSFNASYPSLFQTFSAPRLFSPIDSTVTEVKFFVPGTSTPATTHGFGAIFTDVDKVGSTSIQLFDADNNFLTLFNSKTFDDGVSFLGFVFDAGERIGRVVITSGNTALNAGTADADGATADVVVMDDFIFAEPKLHPGVGSFEFSAAAYSVGESGPVAVITVNRNGGNGTATVNVATSDGTAVAPGDYADSDQVLTFGAGVTSQTITIPIVNDTIDEPDETINLALSNPTGLAVLGSQSTATLTILDDDATPTVSINDVTLPEGTGAGATPFNFTVSLSNPSSQEIIVSFLTADDSATLADNDYSSQAGNVTFAAGQITQTITVQVTRDSIVEPDETFVVNLTGSPPGSGPVTLGDLSGTGTITNDDSLAGSFEFSAATYSVGEGGPVAVITVNRNGGSSGTATVNVATSDGSATAPADYTNSDQVLTFGDGVTSQSFTVAIVNDTIDEPDETVSLALSNPTGGAVLGSQSTATLTIQDDDATPTVSVNDVTLSEGTGASTTPFNFTVSLSNPSSQNIVITYTTNDGTATLVNNDYVDNDGSVTFTAGQTTQTITVQVNRDALGEPDETFNVQLLAASLPATVVAGDLTGAGTITNDDALAGSFEFSAATYSVGESGPVAVITVNRTGGSVGTATVTVATSDGTAVAPGDYTDSDQVLTFGDGVTSQSFTVAIVNDTIDEPDETVNLALSNPTGGAGLGSQSTATLTIQDNDATPTVSVNDVTLPEGTGAGATPFNFTVSLSNPSSQNIIINYTTNDGTATLVNNDYVDNDGSVTFTAGQTTQTITVQVNRDAIVEPNETFNVQLLAASLPATVVAGDLTGTGTITNDDAPVGSFEFSAATYSVGESGPVAVITVNRVGGSSGTAAVSVSTSNGTAVAPGDYTDSDQVLTFASGVTSRTFTVPIVNDTIDEPNETVNLALSNPTGGAVLGSQSTATLTIQDNDATPTVSVNDVTLPEGTGAGTTAFNFTVSLSNPSSQNIIIAYTTNDGTATLVNNDYVDNDGSVTFTAGQTTRTITVQVNRDAIIEPNEAFNVQLLAASLPATVVAGDLTGAGTIANDDSLGLAECDVATLNLPGPPNTAALVSDADNPSQKVLRVTGTTGHDTIIVEPIGSQIRVRGNGIIIGTFTASQVLRVMAFGLAGNDTIIMSASLLLPAVLFGNEGNDYLYGARGADGLDGGPGNDYLFAGAGNDTLCGDVGNDVIHGQDGDDNIGGEGGNDILYGLAGNDRMLGGTENDLLFGGLGNDRLFGESGNDTIYGEAGNDIVSGGDGNDTLYGHDGRDILLGGLGADLIFGHTGDDILFANKTSADTNEATLANLLATWSSTTQYLLRIQAIISLNITHIEDNAVDTLFGNDHQDWFLIGLGDKVKDKASNEIVS